jgi:hypothetical protein
LSETDFYPGDPIATVLKLAADLPKYGGSTSPALPVFGKSTVYPIDLAAFPSDYPIGTGKM